MAKDDDALDLDTAGSRSGGGMKIVILMVVIALLVSASIIGTLYFTGNLGGGAQEADAADAEDSEAAKKPAIYVDMDPAFIVNFPDNAVAEYLQIEMQVLTRDPGVAEAVTAHMPVIRNDIVLLLSSQQYSELKSRAGKQQLQQAVLEKIREIVATAMREKMQVEEGEEVDAASIPNVENVYFTSFIMQ